MAAMSIIPRVLGSRLSTQANCTGHIAARPALGRRAPLPCRSLPESTVVTDAAVPEGHKGLHGLLYGEGGAERHDAGGSYQFRKGEDDGSAIMPAASYLDDRDGEKPLGVYAVYDSERNLQYVGYSRNIVLAVRAHMTRVGEERCAFVRAMVFANKAMATRANLEQEAANWLQEAGTVPPGNGVEREQWEGSSSSSASTSSVDTSAMSAAELAEYEEKKLKMRKAMGENLNDDVSGETEDSKQRRLNMIRAVEGDDWSAVIDGQTQATVMPSATSTSDSSSGPSSSGTGPVVSPFSSPGVHRAVGSSAAGAADASQKAATGASTSSSSSSSAAAVAEPAELPMTREAVDKVLDEVRPYLLADGGDVEVAAVEAGNVYLTLQGSCSSCASSSVTMKMGIERALKAAYGDRLKEVIQVGQKDPAATVELVDMQLNMLRGAISSLGGSVEVLKVEGGKCELKYIGPDPIAKGISAAIKDRFKDISEVVFTK